MFRCKFASVTEELQKINEIKCHYIIGMGHSGTTLLSSILNCSSEILVIPETHATMHFFQSKYEKKKFNDKDINHFTDYYKRFYFVKKMKFFPEYARENIEKIDSYRAFLNNTFLSLEYPGKSNEGIKCIVEKNPLYTYYVKDLLKISPAAKFIMMIRDPRAYVNSCIQKKDGPGTNRHPLAFHMYVWNQYYNEMEKLFMHYPGKCILVHYENLVREPEKTLRHVCEHLEVLFSTQMLEHHKAEFISAAKNERFFQDDYFRAKVEALENSINMLRTDAWKKSLTEKEIALINFVLGSRAQKLGYEDIIIQPLSPEGTFFSRGKYRILIYLYFLFARLFYHLPVMLREIVRKKV